MEYRKIDEFFGVDNTSCYRVFLKDGEVEQVCIGRISDSMIDSNTQIVTPQARTSCHKTKRSICCSSPSSATGQTALSRYCCYCSGSSGSSSCSRYSGCGRCLDNAHNDCLAASVEEEIAHSVAKQTSRPESTKLAYKITEAMDRCGLIHRSSLSTTDKFCDRGSNSRDRMPTTGKLLYIHTRKISISWHKGYPPFSKGHFMHSCMA